MDTPASATHSDASNARPARRVRELDALRGIAALGVVLFHFTTVYDQFLGHEADIPHVDIGQQGVQLFFMISGFVIFMSFDRISSGTEFVVGRALRLYPTYWAGVVITSAVIIAFRLPGHDVSAGQFLAHLTMVHRWFGVSDIDGVYWTLAVELGFYALMLGAYQLRVLNRIELVGGVVIGALFLLLMIDAATGYQFQGVQTPRIFAGSLHLFFAGILLYRLPTHHSPAAVGLLAFCVVVEGFVNPQSVLIVVLGGAVIGLVAFDRLPLLRFRPLLFLGSISYPLYLLHQKVGDTIIYQLYRHGIDHPLLILGLPIAATILLATLVHYTVEVPAQRQLRAWRRRADGAPAATPSVHSAVPAYNACQASSEEAPQWRQPRRATPSPAPATTSRI